ncbi:hypothetical protein M3215_15440 [Bacillus cytotoxicus]|uniref:Uncharacterized protein n=1 Tax=Bacillus cytotoxicus TaxID=580165 RepID=A0ACC6A9Z0_9BACI|nr:hypothetical protein [Bacillus cytotoxicus]
MKAKEIHMLDRYAEDFNFPALDNYNFDLAQCRLTVFRDKERWLIVFEMVVVDEKQDISKKSSIYLKNCLYISEYIGRS